LPPAKSAEIIKEKKYTGSMFEAAPQVSACGDRMVMVEFSPVISPEINDAVHRLAAALENERIPGIVECTPSYHCLGVHYNPLEIGYSEVIRRVREILESGQPDQRCFPRRVEVPIVYGGDFGPDLKLVAHTHRLTTEAVVGLHTAAVYRVCLIGFTPGFPYLSGLPEMLATPRLATPRASVPAGSVAIGAQQCGIYPVKSPGGWNIIGRTPLRLFDVQQAEPCLLAPGDEVMFRGISDHEFDEIVAQGGTL
jgi:KipI family sensor histidine kinase inhibitor